MASLDEAFGTITENSNKAQERTLKSIIQEREKHIEPFTQKQNEQNGNFFMDKEIQSKK